MKDLLTANAELMKRSPDAHEREAATVLEVATKYDGSAEDKVIADITDREQKKWKTIRSIIGEESQKNKELKTELGAVLQ